MTRTGCDNGTDGWFANLFVFLKTETWEVYVLFGRKDYGLKITVRKIPDLSA